MRRVALSFALALLMSAGAGAAIAQSDDVVENPAGEAPPATWRMDVVAGVDGWVAPTEPLPVRVTMSSDLLLVGRIDISVGGVTNSQAIEVPAGGVKNYLIQAAAPGQRRQVRVALVSDVAGEETVLESSQLSLRVPARDLVVAVIDAEEYESAIRSATPTPMEQDIQLVRLGVDGVGTLNSAVSYLVIPTAPMGEIDPDSIELIRAWVEQGGRLIGSAANVSRVSDPAGGGAFVGAGAVGASLGLGEVTAVTDFAALDVDGWSDLLRSVPQPGIVRVQDEGGNASLVGAALSGRSATVPALPWLLLGILLFVVLVGPVNFIVLRGFGKPEWAWVTVPLLSAIFVAGFWMVGRSQLQPFTVTHTSVVVETSRGAEGHTAFVLQVESGGEHTLRMEQGWSSESQSYPGATPGVASTDGSGASVVSYELDDLGVGTAQGSWTSDQGTNLEFALQPTDTGFDVVVTNSTDLTFDTWGVIVDGLGWLATDDLFGQGEATVAARTNTRRNTRYQPVILEAVERRGFVGEDFYNTTYQQIYPMSVFAERVSKNLDGNGIHFFGFTDSETYDVAVDGTAADSVGTTLVVVEVPDTGVLDVRTSARPRLLGVDGASSVEQYFEEIYAYGAESVFFHYAVPTDVASGKVSPGFTSLSVSEVFDWTTGEFVEFEWGDSLDLNRFASPTGEVVIRAGRADDDRFFDESLTLSRFSLEWGQQ